MLFYEAKLNPKYILYAITQKHYFKKINTISSVLRTEPGTQAFDQCLLIKIYIY